MSDGGYLTTHVLDTARGCPAAGLSIDLFRIEGDTPVHMASVSTNDDGRTDAPILPVEAFRPGTYELVFHAGDYLTRTAGLSAEELFLDHVPLRFNVTDAGAHYHVPLLLSPFGYSTYRGS